jgi:hypothetical protein
MIPSNETPIFVLGYEAFIATVSSRVIRLAVTCPKVVPELYLTASFVVLFMKREFFYDCLSIFAKARYLANVWKKE